MKSTDVYDSVPCYYILDTRSTVGGCATWWRPNSEGYTCNLTEAGLYTDRDKRMKRSTDVFVHMTIAHALSTRHVRLDQVREQGVLEKASAGKRMFQLSQEVPSGTPMYCILATPQCEGNCALWWDQRARSYTCDFDKASLYAYPDAALGPASDVPVRFEVANAMAVRHVPFELLRARGALRVDFAEVQAAELAAHLDSDSGELASPRSDQLDDAPHGVATTSSHRPPLRCRSLRFLDTEKLGLGENQPIIEIGIVDITGKTVFESYIRPDHPDLIEIAKHADPIALEWSGFLTPHGDVDPRFLDAPTLLEVAPRLHLALDGCQVWGQNIWFDINSLRLQLTNMGWDVGRLGLPCFGIEAIAAEHLPHLTSFSLKSICEELRIDMGTHHRAVHDAESVRQVYLSLMRPLRPRASLSGTGGSSFVERRVRRGRQPKGGAA